MQCLRNVDCRAGYRILGDKHGDAFAQRPGGKRRGERRQHREAVFLADLPHRLDDDRLARADGENPAAELAAHKDLENLAGLDPVDRHADNDEIRKKGREYFFQVVGLRAFAGDEAEIFKDVGEERSKVLLAIRDAHAWHHLAASKNGVCLREIAAAHRVRHRQIPPPEVEGLLAARMVSNMVILRAELNYSRNVKRRNARKILRESLRELRTESERQHFSMEQDPEHRGGMSEEPISPLGLIR